MRESGCWTFHLRNCEDVTVSSITIDSHGNRNNDGIDIDGGKRISIVGCNIFSDDDAIVLKSFVSETISDIVIGDCIISSHNAAIKIGTESVGVFENISISNCVINRSWGIALFSADGAIINNVIISNITLRNCSAVFMLRLGAVLRPFQIPEDQRHRHAEQLKNIMVSNIQATGIKDSQDFISGFQDYPIENVVLSNISIEYAGMGTQTQAQREIPHGERLGPRVGMFGDLPSYGFFVRHVNGIRLENIRLSTLEPDERPAFVFDNVSDVDITNCVLEGTMSESPLICLRNVTDAMIRNNRPKGDTKTFVDVSGKESQNIVIKDNMLLRAKNIVDTGKDVKENAVKIINNIVN